MSMHGPGFDTVQGGTGYAPLEQPKVLFRFGEQSIWSTYLFPGASVVAGQQYDFFATAQGRSGQNFTGPLTIAETNMKNGGRVPQGVAYDVYGIAAQIYKCTAADDTGDIGVPIDTEALTTELLSLQYNGVLVWNFTQTQVEVGPLDLVGAGGGAFGAVSTTQNLAQVGHMNNGAATLWMYRKHPVALPGTTTFGVLLRFGSRAAPVGARSTAIRIVLIGFYKNLIEVA
jgi:hypothetical protein